MSAQPPKWPLRFLRWFCREDYLDEIEGDLIELFERRMGESPAKARKRFVWDVVKSLRMRNMKPAINSKHKSMFNFNPKQTFRILVLHGGNTASNLTGLTVGLLSIFFLYFYVHNETTTDRFHNDGDRIFRVIQGASVNGDSYQVGTTPGPLSNALSLDFPDAVGNTCRAMYDDILLSHGDKKFIERKVVFADPNFFTFFSFPLSEGLPGEVLRQPNSIVLSKETATRYFGDENPVGKTMLVSNKHAFVVTGILEDPPGQSHLEFDIVVPLDFYSTSKWMANWQFNSLFTYIRLEKAEASSYLWDRFPQFSDKYFGSKGDPDNEQSVLLLEPLTDIYFNNQTRFDQAKHGDIKTISFLIAVGLGILFIVSFNYANLSISQTLKRTKEVSIRRILGGNKLRLVLQFLGESIVLTLASILLTSLLVTLTLPWLNNLAGLDIRVSWGDPALYWFSAIVFFLLTLISCISPALLTNVTVPLAGSPKTHMRRSGVWQLRKVLVTAQFVISISIISLTLVAYWQIRYVSEKDLGFSREAVVLLDTNRELAPNKSGFVEQLTSSTSIDAISYSSGEPGRAHEITAIEVEGLDHDFKVRAVIVDENYQDVFGISLKAGRKFSKNFHSDEEKGIIINEMALDQFGLSAEDAIGKLVTLPERGGMKRKIVGIVSNYHFASLRNPIEPLVLVLGEANWRIAIKIKADKLSAGVAAIFEAFDKYSPGYPIAYSFLDDSLTALYAREQQENMVFTCFASESVFLACLGILGLVMSAVHERQKEFAIRKVVGASVGGILKLVSGDFMLLIALAFVIAFPLSWHFAMRWLEGFAYRIESVESMYLLLTSGAVTAIIVLATIVPLSYKTAVSNPVKNLRYE